MSQFFFLVTYPLEMPEAVDEPPPLFACADVGVVITCIFPAA